MNGRKAKALKDMAKRVALEDKLDAGIVYKKFKKIFKAKKLKI